MRNTSPEFLNECFDLDVEIGVLTWKHRPLEHFSSWRSWHSWTIHAAGKIAGNYRSDGYIRITIDKKRYYAHRIIYALSRGINLRDVPSEIDHEDKDHRNNRPENLRPATRSQNVMNTVRRIDNTSGFKGVGFDKRRGGWTARVRVNGKTHHLGVYYTPQEAGKAREQAANDLHGDFARHDTIEEAA